MVTSSPREAASTAYNLKDGSKAWECQSTGSDADVCLTSDTNKAHPEYGTAGKDLGIHTYPGEDYKIGGGTALGLVQLRPRAEDGLLLDR